MIENLKVEIEINTLEQFVYEYAQNHVYISKKMISGVYISKYNPEHNNFTSTELQKRVKRKIGSILITYKNLGIAVRRGQNTVMIDREKLKEFTPKQIKVSSLKNY